MPCSMNDDEDRLSRCGDKCGARTDAWSHTKRNLLLTSSHVSIEEVALASTVFSSLFATTAS
jgi:hypothetical protein